MIVRGRDDGSYRSGAQRGQISDACQHLPTAGFSKNVRTGSESVIHAAGLWIWQQLCRHTGIG